MSFSNLIQLTIALLTILYLFTYLPIVQSIISLNLEMWQTQLITFYKRLVLLSSYQMKAAHMNLSKKVSLTLVFLQILKKSFSESCNFTDVNLQICEGSGYYLKGYPSTYPLEVHPTLTFFNLGDFDQLESTVTVFVSLKTEWYDSRLSLPSTSW